ncbi:uncharacterized protein LOC115728224 [Rhodamnia argentea]|uniref:Uncharacterized protein LOC115728224 n=1 Tax=Rhodamnia argentea TaxID=178133 RepID=A0A8B8MWE1_9MYRT|nr:uncharacterized protein LOC115728224 [Rhodamnia argentea]
MANNTKKVGSKKNKLITCIKAPIRIFMKAKNFYVSSMVQCSGRIGYGGFTKGPGRPINDGLLKNLSISSSRSSFVTEEDMRELIRDASTRGHLNGQIQMDLVLQRHPKTNGISTAAAMGYVPRSFSTVIGRIDEDKPCEFEDNDIRIDTIVRPRSRSHAVSWRRA